MDKNLVLSWLQDICNQPDTTFIFHNAMYDICWLRSAGVIVKGKIVDTMIAASLIDENRMSYQLNTLAKFYVGMGKDEIFYKQQQKNMDLILKKICGDCLRFLLDSTRNVMRSLHLNFGKD